MTHVMRISLRKLRRLAASLGRRRDGTAAIEMAFLAPILVFMAAGMIDFGLGVYTKMQVADAAQAGAAYAQLNASSYVAGACTTNSPPCAFDTSVQSAATQSHSTGTTFISPVTATAKLMFCCLNGNTVDLANCSQPPSAAPTCTPAAGTYMQVETTANFTTIIPYSYVSQTLNLGINLTSPLAMTSYYLVRIQ